MKKLLVMWENFCFGYKPKKQNTEGSFIKTTTRPESPALMEIKRQIRFVERTGGASFKEIERRVGKPSTDN